MLNTIIIMGRITRDVELRTTQSGTSVASITLACERDYKDQSGNKSTDFIDVVAFKGVAETLSRYFTKGQMIAVSGRLQLRDWTDRDGNKRRSAEIVADNVYFTDSKKDRGEGHTAFQAPTSGADFAELEEDDGDLPFENGL